MKLVIDFDKLNCIVDEIIKEWESDNTIDMANIAETVRKFSNLHPKYVRYLSEARMFQIKAKESIDRQIYIRKQWYDGHLSKEELEKYELSKSDPWKGISPTRTPKFREEFISNDEEIRRLKGVQELIDKTLIPLLEELVKHIAFKHQSLEIILNWRKYEAGF